MLNSSIDMSELAELAPKIRRAINHSTSLMAQEVWGNLMEESPQDHGRLAGSWTLQQRGERQYLIGTPVEYAAVQNDGSDPYDIFPKNKSALKFEINGQTIFAKRVRHPGIKGKKYIEKSIDMAVARHDDFVEMGLQREGL